MRVSKVQAARNREHIVEVASREFRDKGFSGIGVADVMKSAGFTHGGFYGHFASKEELMAEACAAALQVSANNWEQLATAHPDDALAVLTQSYLQEDHRDNRAMGCTIAALAQDITRHGGSVRKAFTRGLTALLGTLAKIIPGQSEAVKRQKAIATMAGLVGTLVLSRAVDDRGFADEILRAGRAVFGARPIQQ